MSICSLSYEGCEWNWQALQTTLPSVAGVNAGVTVSGLWKSGFCFLVELFALEAHRSEEDMTGRVQKGKRLSCKKQPTEICANGRKSWAGKKLGCFPCTRFCLRVCLELGILPYWPCQIAASIRKQVVGQFPKWLCGSWEFVFDKPDGKFRNMSLFSEY